ncbi:MAG: hypothetical protein WCZ89_00620 [Phycisphaerae bacterium]
MGLFKNSAFIFDLLVFLIIDYIRICISGAIYLEIVEIRALITIGFADFHQFNTAFIIKKPVFADIIQKDGAVLLNGWLIL